MTRPTLLGLSGSLRANSYHKVVLETLAQRIAPNAEMSIFPLNAVPLYNQDLDTEEPLPAVAALRQAITEADGLIIGSPEYNHGMSGVLKNALDWASRPFGQAPLLHKPVITFTAAPGVLGGVRAHAQLNQLLIAIPCKLVICPQAVIPHVANKIVDGRLQDDTSINFLMNNANALMKLISETTL